MNRLFSPCFEKLRLRIESQRTANGTIISMSIATFSLIPRVYEKVLERPARSFTAHVASFWEDGARYYYCTNIVLLRLLGRVRLESDWQRCMPLISCILPSGDMKELHNNTFLNLPSPRLYPLLTWNRAQCSCEALSHRPNIISPVLRPDSLPQF